ncbi:MAG: alpha/beta fold hydrolase [Flavobacteriia bacterium]|jgi:pimeloyl-ACP methyl ester carboxylesterase
MNPFFYMPILQLGNVQLHFESITVPSSERDDLVLIFLHEALGSIPQWRNFPPTLCSSVGLSGIVYERQGYGQSSPLSQVRNEKYLHDYALCELPAFIEEILPPEKRIILVGHSDGGTIALLYASAFPKRVAGIITLAAHVINEPETIAGIRPAVQAYAEGKLDKLKSYHGEKTDTLFKSWSDTWQSKTFQNWTIENEIQGIQAPSLILQGQRDQYGTQKQLDIIGSSMKVLCFIEMIPGLGHHPHLEDTIGTAARITSFINEHILLK